MVTSSTIAYNSVANGGAGGGLDLVGGGTATLDNTIVALNTEGTGSTASPSDIAGTVSSASAYNLIGTGGSGALTNGTNGNQVGVVNPGLGPLADNGGPTQTIALWSGSDAIDKGSNALAVDPSTGKPLTTDQRGAGFPRIFNGTVDIGAYEVQTIWEFVVTAQPPASVTAGSGFGLTVTVEDSTGNVDSSFNGTVSLALYNNPGGATLGGTLTTTAQSGVAAFSGLTLDNAATGYTLLVSGGGVPDATTNAFNVTAAAATQLSVTTEPPAGVGVGVGFGLVVSAEDQFGNVDLNFNGSVDVALLNNPGGAALGGTLSVAAQSGAATFSGLTLDQAGAGYTLQLSAIGLTSATTNAFNVSLPNVYTVDLTSASGAGSGSAGDLVYTIGLANANTNPFGSIIQFDPTVFASPQTITLASTLELSETAGSEAIDGPGASIVTVSGGGAVGVFSVTSGVIATISGLTISGGFAGQGGGIDNAGTLTVNSSTIANNSTPAASSGGGGIYNAGTLTVTNSTVADNNAFVGGGIYNAGTLTVTNSTVAGDNNDGHRLGRRYRKQRHVDGHQLDRRR